MSNNFDQIASVNSILNRVNTRLIIAAYKGSMKPETVQECLNLLDWAKEQIAGIADEDEEDHRF